MKYISYKVLYTMLPKRIRKLPTADIDNWIIQCIRLIDASPLYERKMAYSTVRSGKAKLPDDFIRLYGVYYNHTTPTDKHLASLLPCMATEEAFDCSPDTLLEGGQDEDDDDGVSIAETQDSFAQRNSLVRMTRLNDQDVEETFYVFRNYVVSDYINSLYHKECWIPLRLTDKIFSGCYLENESPCWKSNCDYSYSLTKCNELLTTLPNGYVMMIYTGRLTDANGDYLVPDNQEWLQVLKEGVIMMYYEDRRLDSKQGAMGNHQDYQANFFRGVAYLRGKQFYPNTAEKDKTIQNIIHGKIAIANNYNETGNSGFMGYGYKGGSSFNHINL